MGKQTMGTPLHALRHRADNKLYKLQTPQSPVVRPAKHDWYAIDNYPLGTNAVIAVISYTVSYIKYIRTCCFGFEELCLLKKTILDVLALYYVEEFFEFIF